MNWKIYQIPWINALYTGYIYWFSGRDILDIIKDSGEVLMIGSGWNSQLKFGIMNGIGPLLNDSADFQVIPFSKELTNNFITDNNDFAPKTKLHRNKSNNPKINHLLKKIWDQFRINWFSLWSYTKKWDLFVGTYHRLRNRSLTTLNLSLGSLARLLTKVKSSN